MFCLADLLRTYAQESASQIALRDSSREVREKPCYTGGFENKTGSQNIKISLLLIKEN